MSGDREQQGASLRVGLSPKGHAAPRRDGSATSIPRASQQVRADAIIAEYLAAWSEKGGEPPFRVAYVRGWVRFAYGERDCDGFPKRLSEIVKMTERIRARARDERTKCEDPKGLRAEPASPTAESGAPKTSLNPRSGANG